MVSGRVSWFGGPTDTGIGNGHMTISGELARGDNSPLHPTQSTLDAHREAHYYYYYYYYYYAVRLDYSPNGTSWWRTARFVVTNPRTGVQVVVRPADWGPNTFRHRIIDLSARSGGTLARRADRDGGRPKHTASAKRRGFLRGRRGLGGSVLTKTGLPGRTARAICFTFGVNHSDCRGAGPWISSSLPTN
jgi:hypothetical protein